jgi:hypothetical protein
MMPSNILFNASLVLDLGILPLNSQFITESSVTPSFPTKYLIKSPESILDFLNLDYSHKA